MQIQNHHTLSAPARQPAPAAPTTVNGLVAAPAWPADHVTLATTALGEPPMMPTAIDDVYDAIDALLTRQAEPDPHAPAPDTNATRDAHQQALFKIYLAAGMSAGDATAALKGHPQAIKQANALVSKLFSAPTSIPTPSVPLPTSTVPVEPTVPAPTSTVPAEPVHSTVPQPYTVPQNRFWRGGGYRPVPVYSEERAAAEAERQEYLNKYDPLVFDLNGDGDTDATVDQRGIEVDGATATKWAEAGDGVLAFGGEVLDTDGGRYADAYANLRARAAAAGLNIAKGHLDAADLAVLEARGLALLVSNGDGTNRSARPTELGISRIELSGQAVDKQDAAGNRISTEGSFVRDGRSQRVNDMWFHALP